MRRVREAGWRGGGRGEGNDEIRRWKEGVMIYDTQVRCAEFSLLEG